ncbi:rRNA accumulation-related protein [Savitreella phatthalungensis]
MSGQQYFELGVALTLYRWEALTLAVSNGWGGAESEGKRDWLAGIVVDMFPTAVGEDEKSADVSVEELDIEDVLMQVMSDEFEVSLEDDSAIAVAREVIRLHGCCCRGDFDEIKQMKEKFEARGNKATPSASRRERTEGDDDDSSDEGDEDHEDGNGDDEMMDVDTQAGEASTRRHTIEPVVDEDGFELVQKKGRRQ